jgi:hypothetical protein
MNALSGRSARIQELANLKADGELTADEFHASMAAILSYKLEAGDGEEWLNSIEAAPSEEAVNRDNCTAVAGAIGIASIAAIFLFIALVVAHQNPALGLLKTRTPASAERSNAPVRLPFLTPHKFKFAA